MKKNIKSFISFTNAERKGLIALCALLLILIAVRATMSWWVHPKIDTEDQKRLTAAWEAFKRSQPEPDTTEDADEETGKEEVFYKGGDSLPDTIDLNSADSATLVRLKGIGPATAHKIMVRRTEEGPFTDVEQLKEVGHFNDALFELLKKHLTVVVNKQHD